jgi:hypothetical protein
VQVTDQFAQFIDAARLDGLRHLRHDVLAHSAFFVAQRRHARVVIKHAQARRERIE